ncbi:hypothetical protein, partial [Streptomyces mirabilis]|uniref:hypothetical protein n=1 Tax=Streptomyces mirabilis TaxID=68239 RepID=UPI0036DE6898
TAAAHHFSYEGKHSVRYLHSEGGSVFLLGVLSAVHALVAAAVPADVITGDRLAGVLVVDSVTDVTTVA